MTTLSDRLRRARVAAGFATATDAATAFGWNGNSYRSAENGMRPPGRATLVTYARAFKVSTDWLLTGRGPMEPTPGAIGVRQIPIIRWGDVASFKAPLRSQLLNAEAQGYVAVPESVELSLQAFALQVEDNSMTDPVGSPQSLYPGDYVIIEPEREPRVGNLVLARDGGKAQIRKLRVLRENQQGKPTLVGLVPLNPDYPTHEVQIPGPYVVGVMAGFFRRATR